jgi:hypothetical protein
MNEDFSSVQCGGGSNQTPTATVSFPTITTGDWRITEDGQDRLTEDGQLRLLG